MTHTHLSVLVDRSGSMASIRDDMLGGLSSLFADQAEQDGKCTVDYAQFDTKYERVFENTLVASAKPVLEPRGGTALLDGLGRSISELKTKLENLPENFSPDKIIFVVVTDGHENSSREFNAASVKKLVEANTEAGWEFVFLGANMDAVEVAQQYGFAKGSTLTYSTANVGATSAHLSEYVTRSRSGVLNNAFTEAEREDAVK